MSSKLTDLTESFPSVLCGSGVFSQLSSPSMASSGQFDPSQTYDGYKACHYCFIGKRPCCCTRVPTSHFRSYFWSSKDRPFGKEFPVPEAPTPYGTSEYSHYAVGSDELDGEEVVVVPHSVDNQSSTSSSQPLANRFQIQVIPTTPRTFQPVLASIPTSLPPALPSPSHARPALNQAVRPSSN
ncbi:hypothetical protein O181_090617 [Austropuccinia psidii MF-1]|uniref:Uncharacterized protein n=1 Tax=Austropuccinia psidii MF-1 TaxID=1389203 RepID=A0A9Q3IVP8_9BASI|nr:hypothetical protein [Austropuccinia psidii MF-1]